MQSKPPELVPTRWPVGSLLTSRVTEICRGSLGAASGFLSSNVRSSGAPMVAHPERAKVVASSFDKSSSPATVALVGSIAAKPAAVVDFYTKALQAQGFKAVPGNTVGTVVSKDFVRAGNETVNIAVPEVAGVSTFTIGANVAPESVK